MDEEGTPEELARAASLFDAGQTREALTLFISLLDAHREQRPSIYNNIAACLGILGRDSEAAEYLKSGLALAPEHTGMLSKLGIIEFNAGNAHAAEQLFFRAISTKPQYAAGWYNLALAYSQTGKLPEAMRALKEAVRLNPKLRAMAAEESVLNPLREDERFKGEIEALVRE